jgi:COP9 signalosome complex subunit 1
MERRADDGNQQKKLKQMDMEMNIDLDVYSQQYEGHAKIDRLLFVAKHSTSLQIDAYKLALEEIEKSFDIEKYQSTVSKLNQLLEQQNSNLVDMDLMWISQRSQSISEERQRLEQELASYKSNFIKESVRMGQTELGEHYYRAGELTSALKCFVNTRDYLTSPLHIVDMACRVIEVSMESGELQNIPTYLFKAKQVPSLPEPQKVKLESISAMLHLFQGNYKATATSFCQIPFASSENCWKYLSQRDIAVYGGLCVLASFDRSEIKTNVMENPNFKQYLELEPQIREMIRAFYNSKFKQCFEIWNSLRHEFMVDMFLAPKMDSIYSLIKSKAMLQYCSPFKSLDMQQMADVFSCNYTELESMVAQLITSNQLEARIDSHNKVYEINQVVKAKDVNLRQKVYKETLGIGEGYIAEAKLSVIRAKLVQQGIVIKD